MAGFKYKRRDEATLEKRATQRGGDFEGIFKDEFRTFAPAKGDNWVRFLPPTWEDPQHYGLDVHVHYSVGPEKATILCPAKMPHPEHGKQRCAVCEARAKAERRGDDEEAKELRVNRRVLVWLLNKQDKDSGPLLWGMPWTFDRDVCKIARDKRTGETYLIDDPDEGYDVTFDKEGEKMQTKYVGLQLSRRPSSVDDDHLDYIQKHPLPDVLLYRTAEEVDDLFAGTGGGDEDDRPRKTRRDEEEEPPRRSRRDADEEPPKRRARDEEEEPPRRSRRAEPEDEAPPKRSRRDEPEHDPDPPRRSRREEPEEEAPRRSRRDADEEPPRRSRRDEEEEAPRRSRRDADEEEAPRRSRRDEEEEPPRRSRREEPEPEKRPASAGRVRPRKMDDVDKDDIPFDKDDKRKSATARDEDDAEGSASARAAELKAKFGK